MIREPGGCFEQTSSTNYPNIMILGYLNANDGADPALVQKTQGVIEHGYKCVGSPSICISPRLLRLRYQLPLRPPARAPRPRNF